MLIRFTFHTLRLLIAFIGTPALRFSDDIIAFLFLSLICFFACFLVLTSASAHIAADATSQPELLQRQRFLTVEAIVMATLRPHSHLAMHTTFRL